MKIPKKDLKIETLRGKGPGGQHKNKTDSMVRITHIPTGTVVTIDGRNQHQNKRQAMEELERRLVEQKQEAKAEQKKANRDSKIHDRTIVRTYDYNRGVVKDHRTKKTAPIKEIMDKGKLDKLK